MKATIIIAGILELLGGLLVLLFGLSIVLVPGIDQKSPQIQPWMIWTMVGGCAFISATYIATAIGLFCRKNWACVMTLLTGVIVFLYALLVGIVATFQVYFDPRFPPSSRLTVMAIAWAMAVPFLGIGAWWTWAFRQSKMTGHFPPPSSPRPLSISLIAATNISGILGLPLVVYFKVFPIMGVLMEGLAAQLFCSAWILAFVILGIGLWRLKEWARIGTLVLYGFNTLNAVVIYLKPDMMNQYLTMTLAEWGMQTPPTQPPSYGFGMFISVAMLGVFSYFLITRRAAFRKKAVS